MTHMLPGTLQLAIAAIVFVVPLVVLAIAALAYGVDSRPSIDERGPHRWMPGG